ncbi:MAG: transposase [Terracidiphilus sp.]
MLTLDRPDAIQHSRQAGAFLGLRPRQSQSGDLDPQHRIGKTGKIYLHSLLVQAAHYVLGRFGPESELRRWGLETGGLGRQARQEASHRGPGPSPVTFQEPPPSPPDSPARLCRPQQRS